MTSDTAISARGFVLIVAHFHEVSKWPELINQAGFSLRRMTNASIGLTSASVWVWSESRGSEKETFSVDNRSLPAGGPGSRFDHPSIATLLPFDL
jgi:hypothetical protein